MSDYKMTPFLTKGEVIFRELFKKRWPWRRQEIVSVCADQAEKHGYKVADAHDMLKAYARWRRSKDNYRPPTSGGSAVANAGGSDFTRGLSSEDQEFLNWSGYIR